MLETERLLMRKFTPADLDNLVELRSDEDVIKYIGGRQTQNREAIGKRFAILYRMLRKIRLRNVGDDLESVGRNDRLERFAAACRNKGMKDNLSSLSKYLYLPTVTRKTYTGLDGVSENDRMFTSAMSLMQQNYL